MLIYETFQLFKVLNMARSTRKFRPNLVHRKPQKKTRWGPPRPVIEDLIEHQRAKALEVIARVTGKIRFTEWLSKREDEYAARPQRCLGSRTGKPVKYVRNTKARLGPCRGCINGRWFSASKHCSEDTPDALQCPYCRSFMNRVFFRVGCSCEKDSESDSDESMTR